MEDTQTERFTNQSKKGQVKMAKFAIVENDIVVEVLVAETKAIADELTGRDCIEWTDEDPTVIGRSYIDGVFDNGMQNLVTDLKEEEGCLITEEEMQNLL